MVTLNKAYSRLFTYIITLVAIFMLTLIWVFGIYPIIGDNIDHSSLHQVWRVMGVFMIASIGLLIPFFMNFLKVGQQLKVDFTHPSGDITVIGEATLLEAIDEVPAGIVMYDINDQLIMCNASFRAIWGYSVADALPGVTHQELGLIDRQRGVKVAGGVVEEYMESRLKYRAVFSDEQVVEFPDGRLISTKDRPLTSGGFISIQNDITELVEARNSFHKSEQQLLDAIEGLDEGFVSFDSNDRMVVANTTYRKMYLAQKEITPGLSFEELIKLSVYGGEIPAAIDCEEKWIAQRLQQHHTQSPVDELLLSSGLWVKTSEHRTANGGVVCISADISEIKRNQAILELYATTDEMTGLLNRRTGLLMLNKLMSQFQRSGDNLAICYIDIDGLKSVNDKFGHEIGDLMIKTISNAAKDVTRDGDIIMRLGGDEFLIVFPHCTTALADTKMDLIKQDLAEIKQSKKYIFELGFSYGTTAYLSESFGEVDEYVAHADKLMYQNKLERRAVR